MKATWSKVINNNYSDLLLTVITRESLLIIQEPENSSLAPISPSAQILTNALYIQSISPRERDLLDFLS